jgi:hypothetical protein
MARTREHHTLRKIASVIAGLCIATAAYGQTSAGEKFDNPLQRATRDFVVFCDKPINDVSCNTTITMLDIGAGMTVKGYCAIGTRDMGLASRMIVHWLSRHPELAEHRLSETYLAATSALWPC